MAPTDTPPTETKAEKAKAAEAAVAEANDVEAAQSEWVFVKHENDAEDVAPARVTRRSFDKKWKSKGFQIVDPTKTGTEADSSE